MPRFYYLSVRKYTKQVILSRKSYKIRSPSSSSEYISSHTPDNRLTYFNRAYNQVHKLLQKQINRPFLKRYLKRDEILRKIQGCDASLNNALGMFSVSPSSSYIHSYLTLPRFYLAFHPNPYPSSSPRLRTPASSRHRSPHPRRPRFSRYPHPSQRPTHALRQ